MKFKFYEHTADLKFRAWGKSVSELFENCAEAVSSIFSRDSKINIRKSKKVKIKEKDLKALLYSFIDQMIYFMDAEDFVTAKANLEVDDLELSGTLYGDRVSGYVDLDQIKAPTYSDMYVKRKRGRWEAQVVVDV